MTQPNYHPQERLKWFLLACFGFVSSLQRYEQPEWGIIAPPLVFPLEPLRANGRPLAIAFLGLLLLIAFATKRWGAKNQYAAAHSLLGAGAYCDLGQNCGRR